MAFQQLKEYLFQPPIMSSLEVDEVLFAYLAITSYAISFVLIRVNSGIQRPVYYVSKSLNEAEVCYLPLENAILVVVNAIRKLPIISKHTPWSSLLSFRSNQYFGVQIILEGLPSGAQF